MASAELPLTAWYQRVLLLHHVVVLHKLQQPVV